MIFWASGGREQGGDEGWVGKLAKAELAVPVHVTLHLAL